VTEAQAVEAIAELWATGWVALHPTDVPFVLDNEQLTAPTTWARVTIVHTAGQQASMGPAGSRRFERRGQIAVQLFGDVNKGRAQLSGLADDVRTVLEAKELIVAGQVLWTIAGTTREVNTDQRWAQCLVVVPFRYYHVG